MDADAGAADAADAGAAGAAGARPPHHPPGSPHPSSSGDDLADELEAELGRASSGEAGCAPPDAANAAPAGARPRPPPPPPTKRARVSGGGGGGAPAPGTSTVCPPHPASMGGICVRCGAAVPQDEVEGGVALR